MKKLFFTLAVCILAGSFASAQSPSFIKGDNVVSLGIGIGGNLYGWTSGSNVKKIPPISVSFEHGIVGNLFNDENCSLGVGGLLAYSSAKWDGGGYGWKSSSIVVGARGAIHYAFMDKLDTYAGLMLGYHIYSHKWTGDYGGYNTSAGASGLAFSFFGGARYYFTNSIAAFAELGYGYAILNLGVSFKL